MILNWKESDSDQYIQK